MGVSEADVYLCILTKWQYRHDWAINEIDKSLVELHKQ